MMYSFVLRYFFFLFPLLGLLIAIPVHAETLSQAWETALANNYSIKAAQETVVAAEEQLLAAKAVRLPSLSIESGYTARDKEPQLIATLGATTIATPVENQHSLAYKATASIPLYTSGRITRGIDAGTAMLKASEADQASVLMNLKMEVAEAYVWVLRAMRGLEVGKSHVASLEAHERDVLALYNQGIVARNDLLASQVSLADASQQLIQTFNRLLQRSLDQQTVLEELSIENINETLPVLTRNALEQRSELTALTKKIQVIRDQAAGVRAEDMPQVALSGGYGYQQNDYLVDEGQWSVTLGLQWNLFDGGISNHKANAISRQANALQQQYNDFATIISLQTRQAWLDTQETQKRLQVTSKAIVQAEENLKVSRNRYSSGLTTNTEVLDAETLRIKSQYNHANACYDRLLAILHLKRAIGEL
ncbi:MAG: TolC family protein [Deltaproteobacteria bacterium]|nr:TolC family protein [Deltaproteobacteria bacterium]